MKVPVALATTAAITLSGEQTIDGVAAVTGDRVLVKDQADQTENGIYVVDTGDWNRAADCDGPYDLVQGSVVYVNAGSTNSGFWYCTSANPVDIESDNITWARASSVLATVSTFWQTVLGLTSASTSRAAAALDASQLISSMTAVTSVDLGADYLGGYDASAPAERKMLVADAVPIRTASGRLTLATGTPVMTSDQTARPTVYFTPYNGDVIPIYDGTRMVPTVFTELALALDSNSGHTGYHQSGKNFDCFVVNDAGTIRLGTGPAWSSDTARGTGAGTTELEMVKGVYVNKVSMTLRFGSASGDTVTVAAQRGTYVGTFRCSANGETQWKLGSAASGGGEAWLGVWNNFNRVEVAPQSEDTVASYTYQSTTIRAMNNSTGNRISFVLGLAEDAVTATRSQLGENGAAGESPWMSISLDSTTTFTDSGYYTNIQATGQGVPSVRFYREGLLGFHFLQATEKCSSAANPITFYGPANSVRALFNATLRM